MFNLKNNMRLKTGISDMQNFKFFFFMHPFSENNWRMCSITTNGLSEERSEIHTQVNYGRHSDPQKDIHILISGTCKYVTLHSKKDFADVNRVRNSK